MKSGGTTHHYIVGDIHGCFDKLLRLEGRIRKHAAKRGASPFIISVGDLVDRGPDSAKVVEHFRLGELAGTHACIMGNHEQEMLRVIESSAPQNFRRARCKLPAYLPSVETRHKTKTGWAKYLSLREYRLFSKLHWTGQGGAPTMASFGCDPENAESWEVDPKAMRYLAGLPLVWQNNDVVVTHALVTPETLKAAQAYDRRRVVRGKQTQLTSVTWRREKPSFRPDPKRLHISGHSIYPKVQRQRKARCIQLDTGCHAGGQLTAYCVETASFLAVGRVLVVKKAR